MRGPWQSCAIAHMYTVFYLKLTFTRLRLRVQTTHSGHMGWKRARHNGLTTAENYRYITGER